MQSWHSHMKKKSLLLRFSILLLGASCVMLAQVSVWLPSAQDVEIDPAGEKKNHVSFGGFYPESVPKIPKPRKRNCTHNCQHYLGTARQGRRKCFKFVAGPFHLERSPCMENTTGFKPPSAPERCQMSWATLFLITCLLDQCQTFINIHD